MDDASIFYIRLGVVFCVASVSPPQSRVFSFVGLLRLFPWVYAKTCLSPCPRHFDVRHVLFFMARSIF